MLEISSTRHLARKLWSALAQLICLHVRLFAAIFIPTPAESHVRDERKVCCTRGNLTILQVAAHLLLGCVCLPLRVLTALQRTYRASESMCAVGWLSTRSACEARRRAQIKLLRSARSGKAILNSERGRAQKQKEALARRR
jgi:hypothetical protein